MPCPPSAPQVGSSYYGRQPGDAELEDLSEGGSGGGSGSGSGSGSEGMADAGALEDSDSGRFGWLAGCWGRQPAGWPVLCVLLEECWSVGESDRGGFRWVGSRRG